MELSKDKQLIRSIIMDHYDNPRNKVESINDSTYCSANLNSPSCIDNITVYLKVHNNVIKDVKFSGIACAISTSSSDIMASLLKNKTTANAKAVINNYLNLINNIEFDEEMLGDLFVFKGVNQQLNRIKCAKIGAEAMLKALEKKIYE